MSDLEIASILRELAGLVTAITALIIALRNRKEVKRVGREVDNLKTEGEKSASSPNP